MVTIKKIPAIRFKGFEEEWEKKKLEEIIDLNSGRDYKHLSPGNIPVYGTGGYMLSVNKALSYKENAIGIGRKGTIDKPYILCAPFWTVDTLFFALPKPNNDLDFIYAIFQRINWKQKDESTGVPSLSKNSISNIEIAVVSAVEQIQIGDYFKKLNDLILLQDQKLKEVTNLKKAMLEKMFPKEHADVPEIRFKGFTEHWEKKKLGEVVDDLYNGQTPSRMVKHFWNGNINWLSSGELNRGVVTKTIEKITLAGRKSANLRIVPAGTFVLAITGLEAAGTRGNCAILGIDTTMNQSCMAIYPSLPKLNTLFLFQWYRRFSEEIGVKYTQGTKQQSFNVAIIKKLEIVLPNVEEQQKIGEYFQGLDQLISQSQQKIEQLKHLKQALLQKMFI